MYCTGVGESTADHFADEPTGNLDEENEQRVLELLNHIHRQGRTIVMVTHNPDLGCVADRVIRLQHGKYLDERAAIMWRNWVKIIGLCSSLLLLSACKQEKVAISEVAPTLAAYDLQGRSSGLSNGRASWSISTFGQ